MSLRIIYQNWLDDHPDQRPAIVAEAKLECLKLGAMSSAAKWRAVEDAVRRRMLAEFTANQVSALISGAKRVQP